MTITPHAIRVARVVRALTVVVTIALVVGFIAVQTFASHYGTRAATVVLDSTATDSVLEAAVVEQEATGRQCSSSPRLTDVVLFQPGPGQSVSVMTFAAAISASVAQTGWSRRFCV